VVIGVPPQLVHFQRCAVVAIASSSKPSAA
jgi:hypothetical protein